MIYHLYGKFLFNPKFKILHRYLNVFRDSLTKWVIAACTPSENVEPRLDLTMTKPKSHCIVAMNSLLVAFFFLGEHLSR